MYAVNVMEKVIKKVLVIVMEILSIVKENVVEKISLMNVVIVTDLVLIGLVDSVIVKEINPIHVKFVAEMEFQKNFVIAKVTD